MALTLRRQNHGTAGFDEALSALADRGESDSAKVEPTVREILDAVRKEGDAAVCRFVEKFEKRRLVPRALCVRELGGKAALDRLPSPARAALELATDRIAEFHRKERDAMFAGGGFKFENEGKTLGLRVRALARVGVYAPGGKARYPSSVLMSAIPAKVAGVGETVLATPLAGDAADDMIRAAAHLAGIEAIVDCGGAQAIAAMAWGTESIPRVDKIVGPGNAYVACAKRMVYGTVAIDSIAGPSEILVVADDTADVAHVAADLLSQAEHDEDAYALLVTSSTKLADAVSGELDKQLADLPRAVIARTSLERHGAVFVVASRNELAAVANRIAPEHLSLQVSDPTALLDVIHHAGAAFVGGMTPEAVGDYIAGPSHVLPTGGAVRFGSPLGVHDFVARTSIIQYSPEALKADAQAIVDFARLEGLEAHARAVLIRHR
jgi:histidinol dehydrogenase